MGRISRADLAKTVYYIQRNGIIKDKINKNVLEK